MMIDCVSGSQTYQPQMRWGNDYMSAVSLSLENGGQFSTQIFFNDNRYNKVTQLTPDLPTQLSLIQSKTKGVS